MYTTVSQRISILHVYFLTVDLIVMAFACDEPDYQHMLYGGIWKHVIFDPPVHDADITEANKHLLHLIQKHHPESLSAEYSSRCISEVDLWYMEGNQIPLTFTKHVKGSGGSEYPVSVPLSFGTTYNFQLTSPLNDSVMVHFVTITKAVEMHQFYIYSHTFYEVAKHATSKEEDQCKDFAPKTDSSAKFPVLSNLARNKVLEWYPGQECDLAPGHTEPSLYDKYKTPCSSHNSDSSCSMEQGEQYRLHPTTSKELSSNGVLKVMSFNIWNFNTFQHNLKYHQRVHRIAKLLKKADPDIVAFQEVRLETPLGGKLGPSQMDHLISALPQYQFVYQPAQMQHNSLEQGRTEEGVAIFSKFPIIHHDYLILFRNQSNTADQNQRVCLHAVISVPVLGKVHLFNTHLSLSHEAREVAATQILDYMSRYTGSLLLLTGDLNATPEEKAIKMLTDQSGLLDVWDLLHHGQRGLTFSCIEEELSKRIDYIFMKKTDQVIAQKMEVVEDNIRADAASDHRAVMATFSKKGQAV